MLDQVTSDSLVAGPDGDGDPIREAHCAVLEMAVADSPLEKTLGRAHRDQAGRIDLQDRRPRLDPPPGRGRAAPAARRGAEPARAYCEAIDGAEIGPCAGSCGTAAFTGRPVFVTDIATDPLWAEYKAVALPHGLRACWSTPIITSGRKVLGTFAMYHREPREPTVRDLALVDLVTQTAALIIDRAKARTKLSISCKRAERGTRTAVGTRGNRASWPATRPT